MALHRLEFKDTKSSKFWEISIEGARTITTYGRIGTSGQTRSKEFASPEKATADAQKKTAEKIKKGYVEVATGDSATTAQLAPPRADAAKPTSEPQTDAESTTLQTTATQTELPSALVEPAWLKPRVKQKRAPVIDGVVSLRSTPVSEEAVAAPTAGQLKPWSQEYEAMVNPTKEGKYQERKLRDKLVAGADLAVLHDAFKQQDKAKYEVYGAGPMYWPKVLMRRFGDDAFPTLMFYFELNPAMVSFTTIDAPEVAHHAAHFFAFRKTGQEYPANWLLRHHENATHGLIPHAVGKHGKPRRAAEAALRHIATEHRESIEAISSEYGPEVAAIIAATVATDPSVTAVPKKAPPLPPFLSWEQTPLPRLAGSNPKLSEPELSVEATKHLLAMFALSTPDNAYSELPGVLDALDHPSCAAMLWSVFDYWENAGFPNKFSWILGALGHVGDDDTVRSLVPYIRTWPGQSAHKRATAGLDVLGQIGSDLAMMHLYGMSQKMRFSSLKRHAGEMVQKIADDRGLTQLELGDRLVPDLGLAADGSMVLDYGARSFTVGFDETLKPLIRDETGKIRKSVPKPGKNDDPELAAAAQKQFSALKKDARTVAAGQIKRLEGAMVSERRWSMADFTTYFINHPLMVHLVRRVVCGMFDGDKLTATFRLSEDRTLANVHDEEVLLADDATIGIPHPIHFSPAELAAWGEVLSDYEILQSFDQIGRAALAMTDAELTSGELTRFTGPIHSFDRYLALEKYGWGRGAVEDAGICRGLIYVIGEGDYLELTLDVGLFTGSVNDSPDQPITHIRLANGRTFGEVDEITRSELLRGLTAVLPTE